MRDLMAIAAELMPRRPDPAARRAGAARLVAPASRRRRARARATGREADAAQVQFHYDVSDDFYALWLDPRRVYSCAYFREPAMTLAAGAGGQARPHLPQADAASEGERFLDIGAGWGGLLLWAAEHYGVRAPRHHAAARTSTRTSTG